jgi:MFS family permease
MKRAIFLQPNYRKLFLARTISNFGNGMTPTALAFAILALDGADAVDLSYVLTAQAIPLVLLLPLGGVIADRMGRARMIGSMDIILSGVMMMMAVAFAMDAATIPLLVVLSALSGVLNALWYPAYPGLPTDIVEDEHLQTANAYISFGSNAAIIAGAATGGLLVSTIGSAYALAIDAATFFVAGVMIWTLRHTSSRSKSGESIFKELHDGWKVFISYRWVVLVVVAFSFIVMTVRATEGVLGPLVAKDHFNGAISWSLITAAEGVGLLVGAIMGSRIRPRRPIMWGMIVTLPAAFLQLSLALVAPLPVIMLAAAAWGIGIELMMIWWITELQGHIPRESIGRVSAYDAFGSLIFGPIGLALAGPLAISIGTRSTLFAGATVVAIAVGATLFSSSIRNLRPAADSLTEA